MNNNYYMNNSYANYRNPYYNKKDDRFIGAFAFPFLLGGVTGAAIAPAFWRPSPYQPYYGPQYYGPYYNPYYR